MHELPAMSSCSPGAGTSRPSVRCSSGWYSLSGAPVTPSSRKESRVPVTRLRASMGTMVCKHDDGLAVTAVPDPRQGKDLFGFLPRNAAPDAARAETAQHHAVGADSCPRAWRRAPGAHGQHGNQHADGARHADADGQDRARGAARRPPRLPWSAERRTAAMKFMRRRVAGERGQPRAFSPRVGAGMVALISAATSALESEPDDHHHTRHRQPVRRTAPPTGRQPASPARGRSAAPATNTARRFREYQQEYRAIGEAERLDHGELGRPLVDRLDHHGGGRKQQCRQHRPDYGPNKEVEVANGLDAAPEPSSRNDFGFVSLRRIREPRIDRVRYRCGEPRDPRPRR